MSGRMYTLKFSAVTVTLPQDLFEYPVPSTKVVVVHRIRVSQSSDAGDAQSEQLRFTMQRLTPTLTSGSGGTASQTPSKNQTGDATCATSTAEINNTTRASTNGTATILVDECENVHNGWDYRPTPEERIPFAPSETIIVGLETAPSDSLTMSGFMVIEEIG